jgi:hypothetical protein
VGGKLCADNASFFAAPCLQAVGCRLEADLAVIFRASRLRAVRLTLVATSATRFVAPVLGYTGRDQIASAAIHFYHSGIKVRGEWSPHPNSRHRERWFLHTADPTALQDSVSCLARFIWNNHSSSLLNGFPTPDSELKWRRLETTHLETKLSVYSKVASSPLDRKMIFTAKIEI